MTVRPFTIQVEQSVLDRIAARLADTRIGYAPAEGGPWDYGMDRGYLVELIDHWRTRYDWRAEEAELNRWPQFRAEVGGIDCHFYHVRGDGSRRLPILLTHGWPGSVVEFQEVLPELVAAGFDVVVPSLPGFGWSGRPARPIGPGAVAVLWHALMVDVLGYSRFFAQGGDWGAAVTTQLAIRFPDAVAAIHLNFFMPLPPGADADAALLDYWQAVGALMKAESGYHHEQATKPQTIGLALHDNPVGWAAWVIEKFWRWGDTGNDIASRFDKNHLITNLMSYLVTDSVTSSLWMYYGSAQEPRSTTRVAVPTGLARFPYEFYPMPDRALAERQYNVVHWTEMPAGGHFAAVEEPARFAADVIAFFAGQD